MGLRPVRRLQASWIQYRLLYRILPVLASLGLAAAQPAIAAETADAYPSQTVRIIVPLSPGGSVDLMSRILAEALTESLGQQFVVENMPGGGGAIGAGAAAQADPDGYTLVMGSSSSFGVNPTLFEDLPYDAVEDFAPVSLVSYAPNALVVPTALPVESVEELVALAKDKPGELTFASSGIGGSPHLAGELFKREAGIDILHIPYKGSGQAMGDLLGGRVDMSFATVLAAKEQIDAGAFRALAVTSENRVSSLPDVPTMAEAGYPNVLITAWNGLLAPEGTPPEIVEKLSQHVQQAMHAPDMRQRLDESGVIAVGNGPEEFSAFIKEEIDKWVEIIRVANIVRQ